MSTSSKGCRRRSRSTRRARRATRARPSAPSPRSTTISGCSTPASASPTAPIDGTPITRQTPQQIVDRILELPDGTRFEVLAPVVRGRKGTYDTLLADLATQGFARAKVDGELHELTDKVELARYEQHTIEVIVDRLVRRDGIERRLTDSLETALRLADGVAEVHLVPREGEGETEVLTFSQHLACPTCGQSYDELAPRNFSFNSPYGALRALRRPGHPVRGRPRAGGPQPRPHRRARSARAVGRWAQPVLQPSSRVGLRGARHPARHARGPSCPRPSRSCLLYGVPGRGQGAVPQPVRPHPQLRGQVRGRRALPAAAAQRSRERLGPRADRGLHARGALSRLRWRPAQAPVAGGHDRRPQHRSDLRDVHPPRPRRCWPNSR